ncbi:uncharacterized protein LOC114524859 [Dendronephthya gigantea]|uniref:uncharacterized protein LOC114524859 n=1 Tax=Dendronephthya gigantea TaxID=151771 RepID=UPI00106C368E|nr:uncharacterized protein LOC114524859 [Dendronephthya gigantea]
MATANLVLVITVATLGFYQSKLNGVSIVEASTGSCIRLPKACNRVKNITNAINATDGINATHGDENIIQQINSLPEATERSQCLSALRSSMCLSSMRVCHNSSNSTFPLNFTKIEACGNIRHNCTELLRKTFGSKYCNSTVIEGYNSSSECVNVTVSKNGYCPYNDTYKMEAANVIRFLLKAKKETLKNATTSANDTCWDEFKRMHCKTFVPSCGNKTSEITRDICKQKLKCLPPGERENKTMVCSNFPSKTITTTTSMSTTKAVTTPYDFTKVFNTTITIRLNIPFNPNYSNKSSSLYKGLIDELTSGLKDAYNEVQGFKGVVIQELTCRKSVAAKHKVVTSLTPNVRVLEARLVLANVTAGYLQGKVVEENKPCTDEHGDDHDDHTDSTNWVYMIVFVCITALLLLAMVLCHQSK